MDISRAGYIHCNLFSDFFPFFLLRLRLLPFNVFVVCLLSLRAFWAKEPTDEKKKEGKGAKNRSKAIETEKNREVEVIYIDESQCVNAFHILSFHSDITIFMILMMLGSFSIMVSSSRCTQLFILDSSCH
jgi:hypothetical protein